MLRWISHKAADELFETPNLYTLSIPGISPRSLFTKVIY